MERELTEAERRARVCLAALNDEASEELVCSLGYEEAWERQQRHERAAGLTYESVLVEADEFNLRVATQGDEEWPKPLDDLWVHAPNVLALWIAGQPLDLRMPVTITGSRACSAYGEQVAQQMAHELASLGHTVVTSLSYGIDAAALRGALAADGPPPVVVLAEGIQDDVPPRLQSHEELVRTLMQRGTVVTEFPPGTKPSRNRFTLRSRILAALSRASVIVEAAARSRVNEVADEAQRLGRLTLAVPGPVTSAASRLPHLLIQTSRARLVTSAQDVVDELEVGDVTVEQWLDGSHTPDLEGDQP